MRRFRPRFTRESMCRLAHLRSRQLHLHSACTWRPRFSLPPHIALRCQPRRLGLAFASSLPRRELKGEDTHEKPASTTDQRRDTPGLPPLGGLQPLSVLQLQSEDKIQLGILFGTSFVIQLGIGVIIPVLPAYAQSIGLSTTDVGLIVAVPSFASAILNLPTGLLVDILGRKRPLVYGSLVDGIGCVLTAMSSGLYSMTGARLLMGAGSAVSYTAAEAYMLDVAGKFPAHRGRLMGVMGAVSSLAYVMGPAIGGVMADRGGVAAPFALIGVSIILMVPLFRLLPETRPPSSTLSSLRLGPFISEARKNFGILLTDRNQQSLLVVQASLSTGWSASLTVLPLWAAATWGSSPGDLGALYSLMALVGFLGSPLGGVLSDSMSPKVAISVGAAACALGFGALPILTDIRALYVSACLIGLGESCLMSGVGAMSADVTAAEQRGVQSALLKQVSDVTFVIMPITLATITTQISFEAAFICTASLMACANGSFLLLAGPRHPRL